MVNVLKIIVVIYSFGRCSEYEWLMLWSGWCISSTTVFSTPDDGRRKHPKHV